MVGIAQIFPDFFILFLENIHNDQSMMFVMV